MKEDAGDRDWTDHWLARDLFGFVEQREDVLDQATGTVDTAFVLDLVRVDRTRPLLRGGSGARREIPYLGIAQLTFKQRAPLAPALSEVTEGSWLRARLGPKEVADAMLYRDLDAAETVATRVSISRIDDEEQNGLLDFVSLNDVQDADPLSIIKALRSISHVAVMNVGQGNANALCDERGIALGYYDLGAGCLWNAATRPKQLEFCYSVAPFVLLSHWDFDHWFGATLAATSGSALPLKWLAPRQVIGPRTLAFAQTLPNLRLWPRHKRVASRGPLSLVRCRGTTKNESGLALFAKTTSGWVASTGDAAWSVTPVPKRASGPLVGLVAPHHGSPRSNAGPGAPPAPGACVAFSFGASNTYSHPGSSPATLRSAGWARQFSTPRGGVALGGPAGLTPCFGRCSVRTVQP